MKLPILSVIALSLSSAMACQICLPFPKDSLLDRMNAAHSLVLAREDTEAAFSLSTIHVLRASTDAPELKLYLPSSTRRMLKVYPERSLLCGWSSGDWQKLAVNTTEMAEVLPQLLDNDWGEDRTQRAHFFVRLLASNDVQLQRMAHIEVARAPYPVIRSLGSVLEFKDVRRFLKNSRMLEWHDLYILLLAQSGEESDQEWIKSRYSYNVQHHSTLQQAAWTLAFLETHEGALCQIQEDYFGADERNEEELSRVLDALSAYGETRPDRQSEIAEMYQQALMRFPAQLSKRIEDLHAWEAWKVAGAVSQALSQQQQDMSIEYVTKVRAYLSVAAVSSAEPSAREERDHPPTLLLWLCGIPLALLSGLAFSKFCSMKGR